MGKGEQNVQKLKPGDANEQGPKKSKGKEPKKELQVVSSAEQELLELATKASTECPRRPFWTHGYREEQGRNGRCSRGGPGNGRDECIRQECRDAGLQWGNGGDYDEGQWRDQGNWYFAGWCSCGSHTGNNAAGSEQNVQKQKPKPGDANEQGPKKSKGKEPKKELQVVSSAEQENMELATKASTECPRRPFWTPGYREEQGRNGRCSRGG